MSFLNFSQHMGERNTSQLLQQSNFQMSEDLKRSMVVHRQKLQEHAARVHANDNLLLLPEDDSTAQKDFPTSLSMYNMGIKNRKVQESTLESVKYLDQMKQELNQLIVAGAADSTKRQQLQNPTTEFFL